MNGGGKVEGEGRGQLHTIATSRAENVDSWFEGGNTDKLLENADEK
jgi:hypothetical protein